MTQAFENAGWYCAACKALHFSGRRFWFRGTDRVIRIRCERAQYEAIMKGAGT